MATPPELDKKFLKRVIGDLAGSLLVDEKFPDPVVPADLDQIRPAEVAADGTVACVRCNERVRLARADLVGSEGYACPACVARAAPAIDPSLLGDGKIPRDWWPTVIAIGAAGGVIGLLVAVGC